MYIENLKDLNGLFHTPVPCVYSFGVCQEICRKYVPKAMRHLRLGIPRGREICILSAVVLVSCYTLERSVDHSMCILKVSLKVFIIFLGLFD